MRYLSSAAAIVALASASPFIMFADNEAGDGNNGGGGNAPAPTPTPAPTVKRYRADAAWRGTPKEGEPKEVSFIIEGPDYKTAWQSAREVTRVGTSEIGDSIKVFDKDGKDGFEMRPGRYTVKDVTSLQDRSRKEEPVTVDTLLAALEAKGVKPNKQVLDMIEELKANPGATLAESAKGDGQQAQA